MGGELTEPAESASAPTLDVTIVVDAFPVLSETFVVAEALALRDLGHRVRVEATVRPRAGAEGEATDLEVAYLADDSIPRKLGSLAWLLARHPLRSLADLRQRARWRREEELLPLRSLAPVARRLARRGRPHLHAHFAAGAALSTLRLSRLLGLPWSVTAHAYDIFQRPRNLREKLEAASFATTGCAYNVRHLRAIVGAEHDRRVHEIVMGVDGERFRRERPYPGGRTVVAVGRLLEKKGFGDLLEAAARLEPDFPLDRVVVVGDGPLGPDLRERAERLGIAPRVEWLGARPHDAVKAVLERADLLVMPAVVASDGDRDSMPVVVKEALAMEVPVVASDEVGLPELVRPPFGLLAPPRDPAALAEAIREVLSRSAEERRAMGRAGRKWVLEECDVRAETARLIGLIAKAGERPSVGRDRP